tara:strand:+ start:100 stop:285 length:186 start_codon:yes stop_codon:yes gene_type:complete
MNIPPDHPYAKLKLEFKDDYKEDKEDKKNNEYNEYDIQRLQRPKTKFERFFACFDKRLNIN